MVTCKDCLHYEVCIIVEISNEDEEDHYTEFGCENFKNKADFVEVIRCKDCKYYTPVPQYSYSLKDYRCDHPEMNGDDCYDFWLDTNEDDFCSYGERKDTE